MNEFADLVVAVTGGAWGIGLAAAREFSTGHASRCSTSIRMPLPSDLVAFACDVQDIASVREAMAQVRQRFGRLDVLVNNDAISAVGTVEDNDDEQWSPVLDVNVVGMARVSAAALPLLRESDYASIVNVCSIAALSGLPQRALYSASACVPSPTESPRSFFAGAEVPERRVQLPLPVLLLMASEHYSVAPQLLWRVLAPVSRPGIRSSPRPPRRSRALHTRHAQLDCSQHMQSVRAVRRGPASRL